LFEQVLSAGITDICLILPDEDAKAQYVKFFQTPLDDEWMNNLKPDQRDYQQRILEIGKHLQFIVGRTSGFGASISKARDFADGESVLVMLGDYVYRSNTEENCVEQLIKAFSAQPVDQAYSMVSLKPVEPAETTTVGVLQGEFGELNDKVMQVEQFIEKPGLAKSEELRSKFGNQNEIFAVFGQYILTNSVLARLQEQSAVFSGDGEVGLTETLAEFANRGELLGYYVDGTSFDLGNPQVYRQTVAQF
jgi:UTP-glucose-1-phosphate uridylyltransferase